MRARFSGAALALSASLLCFRIGRDGAATAQQLPPCTALRDRVKSPLEGGCTRDNNGRPEWWACASAKGSPRPWSCAVPTIATWQCAPDAVLCRWDGFWEDGGAAICPPAGPQPGPAAHHPSNRYALNFDTTPDHWNISARLAEDPEQGYYMIIGDWGGETIGCRDRQGRVAGKMKEFVRRNQPRKLLFVLNVGDSFYWVGLEDSFRDLERTWRSHFGDADPAVDLTRVPWFSVMGNHDYGNNDPGVLCTPQPRLTCTPALRASGHPGCGGPRPYTADDSTTSYQGNQFDGSKQGHLEGARSRWPTFFMPDVAYYYTVPALDLEILALDLTSSLDPHGLGGNGWGPRGGAHALLQACGGSEQRLRAQLARIDAASRELLQERAERSPHRNVVIIQHYPAGGARGPRELWLQRTRGGSGDTVLSAWGHVHTQRCATRLPNGRCVELETGGGGGCCPSECGAPAGFAVVGFTRDRAQRVECLAEPACTAR
jgi:hypothetical protein